MRWNQGDTKDYYQFMLSVWYNFDPFRTKLVLQCQEKKILFLNNPETEIPLSISTSKTLHVTAPKKNVVKDDSGWTYINICYFE